MVNMVYVCISCPQFFFIFENDHGMGYLLVSSMCERIGVGGKKLTKLDALEITVYTFDTDYKFNLSALLSKYE